MKAIFRKFSKVVLWLVTVMLGVLTVLACLDEMDVFAYLLAQFRLQLLVGLVLCLCGALMLRNRLLVIVCVLVSVPNLVDLSPYVHLSSSGRTGHLTRLRIGQVNVNCANGHFGDVVDFLKSCDPDIILIQELTSDWQSIIQNQFPEHKYIMAAPRPDPSGIGTFSRVRPIRQEIKFYGPRAFPTVVSTFDCGGQEVTVVQVHVIPPISENLYGAHRLQLATIGADRKNWATNVVVAGDFNTVPWTSAFKEFLTMLGAESANYHFGFKPTWPAPSYARIRRQPLLRYLMSIPIDQVLVTGEVQPESLHVGEDIGSDHFPLSYQIGLPSKR